MTHEDYQLIAGAIADSRMAFPTDAQTVQRRFTAVMIADAIAGVDPHFDREHFLKDCGVSGY